VAHAATHHLLVVPQLAQHLAQVVLVVGEGDGGPVGLAHVFGRGVGLQHASSHPAQPASHAHQQAQQPAQRVDAALRIGAHQCQALVMHPRQRPHGGQQVHVAPALALADAAEAVRKQGAQLAASEALQRPLGDAKAQILPRPAGSQGVDADLVG
jgi:hypothetical protein